MAESDRVDVGGSERPAPTDELVGNADPDGQASITVYLRARQTLGSGPARIAREDFASQQGADPADVAAVRAFAEDHRLTVGQVDLARRSVAIEGRIADLEEAFGTSLKLHQAPGSVPYRTREGVLTLPGPVAAVVTGVFGLDERPQSRSQVRMLQVAGGYSPIQVAAAYDYPAGTDGTGQTVALIELGGGFRVADLTAYFASLGVVSPRVTAVAVDGGANSPGDPNGPDGEVMLDIEVFGAVAPGASIAVYFAPNTDRGFIDAVTTAVHDTTNRPSVVSISWGGPESSWTAQAMQQMEQAFTDAAALGVTVTVAAGDNGSADGVADGSQHVDFPASAPHALACGGTRLDLSVNAPTGETVWGGTTGDGATGGGVSDVFALPRYQGTAGVPASANPGAHVGRGVPDVAGDADPRTGYSIRVDGGQFTVGGTSAVAPLWAALVVRLNQALGHDVGDLHDVLYANPTAFTDIVSGTNGAYSAKPGWDPCTGLGSPLGQRILTALRGAGNTRA